MHIFFTIFAIVIVCFVIAVATHRTRIMNEFHRRLQMEQDNQSIAAKTVADENTTIEAKRVADETAKIELEKAHPAQNDGHTHDFVSGLAPGGKQLRICKVAGCGFTEGL